MVIIAGFGNPLLDITVKTKSNDLLQKYNLKEDDQIEFNECKMKSLLDDIKQYPTEYTPGGSAQNTLRIFQWLCGFSGNTYMIGGIGIDENGKTLRKLVEQEGVCTLYIPNDELPTGISVALVNQENRSLIASIGAAMTVNIDLFNEITNCGQLLKDVNLFYMEGYFITKREQFAKYILGFSLDTKRLFAFNISAQYICKDNPLLVKYFIENCNILFGNMNEYKSLIEAMDFHGSPLDFATQLSKTNINNNWKYKKIIVITNGSKSVLCIHSGGTVCEFEVPKVPFHEIKDTTGAGDSFVAGFLDGLFKNLTPEICLKYGCWAAQQIIKQVGCKIPDYSPNIEKLC